MPNIGDTTYACFASTGDQGIVSKKKRKITLRVILTPSMQYGGNKVLLWHHDQTGDLLLQTGPDSYRIVGRHDFARFAAQIILDGGTILTNMGKLSRTISGYVSQGQR